MKELSRGDIFLIAFAVVVMVAIYFIYPYTWLGKQSYAEQRQNAINYISAYQYVPGEGYQKEIQRLIDKYQLQDMFTNSTNPIEAMLNEYR